MIFWIIIGMAFYNLAKYYGKNKFLYLGIGIGITLVTQLLVGVAYGILFRPSGKELDENGLLINVIGLLVSGLITYIVYRTLKKKGEKEYLERQEVINSMGAEAIQENVINNGNVWKDTEHG